MCEAGGAGGGLEASALLLRVSIPTWNGNLGEG